jgi:hypothetical protein
LINKVRPKLGLPVSVHNRFVKHLYPHRKCYLWEIFNLAEIMLRNLYIEHYRKRRSLIQDRCYICGLAYSNINNTSRVAHKIISVASKPDIVCLIEPVEEIVPRAYKFTKEYRKMLTEQGYQQFKRGFHFFGRVTFWKLPELRINRVLKACVDVIGSA